MNYDKLTETLRQHGVSCVRAHGRYCSICDEAATALSALQAENEKLRADLNDLKAQWDMYGGDEGITATFAELERVKQERDAAVKDLNEFLAMDELCPIQCEWCKWKDTFCDGKTPEWRGIKED